MKTHSKMTQRILSILLILLMVLSLIPTSVMAADNDSPWLDSSVTATMDGITLYIPEVYCDDCGENVQDAELVIDSVDYAVGTLMVKYHLGRHLCFEISTISNTIRIEDFDCTKEYNEYPVYANAWDQTTSEPVAYLSREAGHVLDEGGICTFCGEMVQTGWVYDSGNWYYYYEDGIMATDAIISNEYGSYYVGSDGVMVVNQKIKVDGVWYQAAEDGTLESLGFDNRWELDSGDWYYYYEDGTMATDTIISDETGNWYYFNPEGRMVKNQWVSVDGETYWAAEDGRLEASETDTHNYVNGFCTDCDAFEPATDENEDGVYEIGNAGQLYWFADKVNNDNANYGSANAILTADIVVNEGVMTSESTDARVWTPIGDSTNSYSGKFEGNSKTVSGLYFKNSEVENVGLFGCINGGTVNNLGVINSYLEGDYNVGGVVAENINGSISKCYNTSEIIGSSGVGGVVGRISGGSVTNCYNAGKVAAVNLYAGGVVGICEDGTITNCFNASETVMSHYYSGAVIGFFGSGTVTDCYYLKTSYGIGIGNNTADTAVSTEAKTLEQFKSGEVAYLLQSTQTEKTWGQKIGTDEFPSLGGDKVYRVGNCIFETVYSNINKYGQHNIKNGFCTVCGEYQSATDENEDGVYEIANAGQLYWFADKVNNDNANYGSANAILTADIVVNEGVMDKNSTDARVWTPIGNESKPYTGIFDGNNKTISGLYVNDENKQNIGLFGYVGTGCEIKSIGIINSYFNALMFVGGIVGYAQGVTITNCYNTSSVVGQNYAGGVAGYAEESTVANCYNTGVVDGTDGFGGMIGWRLNLTIVNCYYLNTSCYIGIGNGSDSEGSVEAKTAEAFAIGEVAYLLQDTQTEEIWGQKIGTETAPVFGGDKVYYGYTSCADDATAVYTNNSNATADKPDHNFENGFCTVCDIFEPATDENGDGVYEIGNAGQLYWFADKVNNDNENFGSANAILTDDIVVNEGTVTSESTDARVWTPIGDWSNKYTGTFDGNDYTVSGLYFNDSEAQYVGLFGVIGENGAVQNTGVINSYFNGDRCVGGVAGYSFGTVTNCYSAAEISADRVIGGVVGCNYGVVTNCYNTGKVSGNYSAGGVVGTSQTGTIINCYNTGEVSGTTNVGGILGESYSTTIVNCYNTGEVVGNAYFGAIFGNGSNYDASNCYYLDSSCSFGTGDDSIYGPITSKPKTSEEFASGEVAYLLQGTQEEEIWGQKIGTDTAPVLGGDKVYYGYASCADGATAVYTNNSSAPADKPDHNFVNGFCTVCDTFEPAVLNDNGTSDDAWDDYYEISNAGQLYWFAAVVNEGYGAVAQNAEVHAKLMADIIVNEGPLTYNTADARVWIPIGKCQSASYGGPGEGVAFNGTFDGNGFTISGLYHPYSKEMYDYAGFIGCLQGDNSQVRDLGIINCFIESRYIAAGIVGTNDGGTVENCYVTGTISTGAHGAGIAGKNTGTVTECYNDALINGLSFGGGIVAFNEGTVSKCYNIGDCRFDTGGGIAYQSTGLVEECYNVVDLSFSRHGAGIVWNGNGEVIRCYNTGNISSPLFKVCGVACVADKIIDCYNTGDVSGDTAFGVGSSYTLVKNCYNTGRITAKSYAVGACPTDGIVMSENCYYLEGMVTSAGTVDVDVQGKSEAKSAEAFTSGEVAYLLQNNREEQIWGQKLGEENIPQFSENKVYKNQIGGCKEENFVYEYSNTQEDAVTTHPGEWIIDASWDPESSESCYVYIDVYCNDCGDYLDYTSCEAELISEEAPINCQNPGKREWSCTFTVSDRTFTETYTEVLRNDVHTDLNDDGFCTACGGYEKPEVDPGEDPEWDYDDVYLIYNAGQLYWFAEYVNNVNNGISGKLMADIDLNPGFTFKSDGSYSFGGIEGSFGGGIIGLEPPRMWTPIGSGAPCYAGNFDGNGFVVSGAYAVSENYYVGLFGNTDYNYEIKNLGISNSYFEGSAYVGGLVGYAYTYIHNCYVTDTVYVNGGNNTAALVGYNGVEIWNSYAMSDTLTGGGWGSLYNCYYLADEEIHNEDGLTFKTAEQFASGEVAYLLQSGIVGEEIWDDELGEYVQTEPEHIWGQKISTDTYPVFGGDKVYTVNNCIDEVVGYSNTEGEILDHNFENGFCTLCDGFEPATDENEDGVYEISNAGQLYWFAEYVNAGNTSANAILTADIVVNEGVMTSVSKDVRMWKTICVTSEYASVNIPYEGEFDGNGKTISGLFSVNNYSLRYFGLFGCIGEKGIVKNLGVINSYIFGGIAGGIVGNNKGEVSNCYYSGSVNGSINIGGVVGLNDGTITGCYNQGDIAASDGMVGGVAGSNNGTITNCYNAGTVSGSDCVGGVVGFNYQAYIANCYNTGEVSGTETDVGGVVGRNDYGTIISCYNSGAVSGIEINIGGVAGANQIGTITSCYYLDTTCVGGINGEDAEGSAEAKTTEQFASGEVAYLLQGEQTEAVWGQKIGEDTYPVFGGDKVYAVNNCNDEVVGYSNTEGETIDHNYVNGFCTVCDGFEPATDENNDGVFEITNAGQLYWFAEYVNAGNITANAILTDDIVVNEGVMSEDTTDARVWTPIGNWSNKYTGTFDGNDYTVSGLYFNDSEVHYVGLFGVIGESGEVKNTGVINSYINGDRCVGGVAGYSFGTVTDCYSAAEISADRVIGGVVGCNYGVVTNSYNTGKVSGNYSAGGVVGTSETGTIINCYNTGAVSGDVNVGGILGENYRTTIVNCYNTGEVVGNAYFGAIFGNGSNYDVLNCYYLDSSCRFGTGDDSIYGPITSKPKTGEEFASGEVAYLLQSNQSESVWGQKLGTDEIPVLGGDRVYTITDSDGNITSYTNTNTVGKLAGYTISLGDKIAVNYYMSLTEKTLKDANAKMVFTVPDTGSTYTLEIPVSEAVKNGDYYVFTCEVAAKEMTSVIKAKLVTSTDELLLEDYTVQKYAEVILSDTVKYANEQALVKAMLNYGAYAQVYFNYNTDNLANDTEYMTDEEKTLVEELDLSAYNAIIEGSEDGVTFYGTTLSLKSETAIKLYFMIEDDVSALTVTVNGEEAELVKNGNLYELKISEISAHLLKEMYEVKVGGLTITYGAMSYANTALSTDKSELKDAVKALWVYAQAASDYISVPDAEQGE